MLPTISFLNCQIILKDNKLERYNNMMFDRENAYFSTLENY